MNCEQIRDRLDELIDGELVGLPRQEVEVHLSDCEPCRAEHAAAAGLVRALRDLPPELPPERELWPEVEVSLRSAPRGWRTVRWLAAAACLVIVSAAALVAGRRLAAPALVPEDSALSLLVAYDETEDEYARASDTLMDIVDARRSELSPETIAEIERNISLIDEALERTRAALEQDPANQVLADHHVAMHDRRLDVLKVAASTPADGAMNYRGTR